MNNLYLTIAGFLQGTLNTYLDKVLDVRVHEPSKSIPPYTFVKNTEALNSRAFATVGIYKKAKQTFVIKQYHYARQNLDYVYLSNEVSFLRLLNTIENPNDRVHAPILASYVQNKKSIRIVTKYEDGITLLNLSTSQIAEILYKVIRHLKKTTARIPHAKRANMGKRPPYLTILTFPYYVLRACMAQPEQIPLLVKSVFAFYQYAHHIAKGSTALGLIHRDLNPSNIIYNRKTKRITYTDLECMVIGDQLYDLALVPRMYARFLPSHDYMMLLDRMNLRPEEKLRLIPLIISSCIIKIATSNPWEISHKNAVTALLRTHNDLIPTIAALTIKSALRTSTRLQRIQRDLYLLIKNPIDYIQICFDPADVVITVKPYNPSLRKAGLSLVKKLKKYAPHMPVLFVGSAALRLCGISNDIDLLVPCDSKKERDMHATKITSLLGKPTITNNRFIKWETKVLGHRAEVIVGYRSGRMVKNLLQAYTCLSKNKTIRDAYNTLKKSAHGTPFREYQKNKLFFFDNVMAQQKSI